MILSEELTIGGDPTLILYPEKRKLTRAEKKRRRQLEKAERTKRNFCKKMRSEEEEVERKRAKIEKFGPQKSYSYREKAGVLWSNFRDKYGAKFQWIKVQNTNQSNINIGTVIK